MSQNLFRFLQVFLYFSTKRKPQNEWMISDPVKKLRIEKR